MAAQWPMHIAATKLTRLLEKFTSFPAGRSICQLVNTITDKK